MAANLATATIGLLIIGTFAGLIYRPILRSDQLGQVPWSYDSLGHLLKARFLLDQIQRGEWFPTLLPAWYLGLEIFRAYPPLPYYLLAALATITGSVEVAGNWFIAGCAVFGASTWLLFQRWLGWPVAILGGVFFLLLPDNVRVAFAEGNLPRVLATALLPLLIYLLLRGAGPAGQRRHWIGLAAGFAIVILTHPMMAGIYAIVCGALAVAAVATRQASMRHAALCVFGIGLGLALSAWWLVPGISGGLADIDSSAMAEGLAIVSLQRHADPTLRLQDPEQPYVGAALIALGVAAALAHAPGGPWPRLLAIVGLAALAISTPTGYQVYRILPLSHLLWPIRFLGVASVLLLLGALWQLPRLPRRPTIIYTLAALVLMIDFGGSLPLIRLQATDMRLDGFAASMAATPGWRQATLDLSRLRSEASYIFSVTGQREQVFGWAYQGARTARTVAAVNEALETRQFGYLADRLNLLGVDDVVLATDLRDATEVERTLINQGMQPLVRRDGLVWLHRDGQPRGLRLDRRALGIGRGARNLAYLFPQIVIGGSDKLDDYALDDLLRYDRVILSGFSWRDRERAESMARQLAAGGVRVVVDLTGTTPDPWARLPRFLGVWGERITLPTNPLPVFGAGPTALGGFGSASTPWLAHIPQGQVNATITTRYLDQPATVVGFQEVGNGGVWFVGLNLPYHALMTSDAAALTLLAETLDLTPNVIADRPTVPLTNYLASANGYRFSYELSGPARLLIPVAAHEGVRVTLDGDHQIVPFTIESLLTIDAPAGRHDVEVAFASPTRFGTGWVVSILAAIGLIGLWCFGPRRRHQESGS